MNWFKKLTNNEGAALKEVKIGNQVWMTENFKGGENSSQSDPSWNSSKYGDIYTHSQAINNAPDGWHLPSLEEFDELGNFISHSDNPKILLKQFNFVFFNGHAYLWTSTIPRQVSAIGDVRCYMVDMGKEYFDRGFWYLEKDLKSSEMWVCPVRYVKD